MLLLSAAGENAASERLTCAVAGDAGCELWLDVHMILGDHLQRVTHAALSSKTEW